MFWPVRLCICLVIILFLSFSFFLGTLLLSFRALKRILFKKYLLSRVKTLCSNLTRDFASWGIHRSLFIKKIWKNLFECAELLLLSFRIRLWEKKVIALFLRLVCLVEFLNLGVKFILFRMLLHVMWWAVMVMSLSTYCRLL